MGTYHIWLITEGTRAHRILTRVRALVWGEQYVREYKGPWLVACRYGEHLGKGENGGYRTTGYEGYVQKGNKGPNSWHSAGQRRADKMIG